MIEDYSVYEEHRNQIKSGDLLIWDKGSGSLISNFLINLVRFFTRSEYGHVGIAWKVNKRLFVIEAVIPHVRIIPLSSKDVFYHVPMSIEWSEESESFLLSKVGLEYSIIDCINAYIGRTSTDMNKWQCAELACEFYRYSGIDIKRAYEPGLLVKTILAAIDTKIILISNFKDQN